MNVQTLEFPYGEVEFTRDEYIDASTLTIQMNRWRFDNGLQPRNLAQILKTDDCKNFMRVCEEETGIVPLKNIKREEREDVVVPAPGRVHCRTV
ncbi:hypothetical protein QA052_gp05 [Salmonella phage MET_P1_001_43]|uniref:Uncharacterized protein n=1 Tax=Salmonella phage MET_P1_001_43 TaxID=2982923 RepID=A0A9E8LR81_9CAUD|nr:hypothetical protein QA052_gp05 [Salmonella phage MET_P1_001_43]UZZ64591.1 hypothetical protein [Salmonella phage MET_P1_001_43]